MTDFIRRWRLGIGAAAAARRTAMRRSNQWRKPVDWIFILVVAAILSGEGN
jgi:hypothetical protein